MRHAVTATLLSALLGGVGCTSRDEPASIEVCGDGRDNDVDGTIDESCPCTFGGACDAGAAPVDAGTDARPADSGPPDPVCNARPVLLEPAIGGSLIDVVAIAPEDLIVGWIDGAERRVRLLRVSGLGEAFGAPAALDSTTGATSFDLVTAGDGTLLVWASEGNVSLASIDRATLALGSERMVASAVGAREAMGAHLTSGAAVYGNRDAEGTPTGLALAQVTGVGTVRRDALASVSTLRSFELADLGGTLVLLWDDFTGGISALGIDSEGMPAGTPAVLRPSGAHARLARSGDRLALAWIDASDASPVLAFASGSTLPALGTTTLHPIERQPDARLVGAPSGAPHDIAGGDDGGFVVVWVDDEAILRAARFDAADRSLGQWVVDSVADPEARPALVWTGSDHVVVYTGGLRRHLRLARLCTGR